MRVFRWITAVVFFLQLPIPLYWFVVHPSVRFWRRHPRAVYYVGLIFSWGLVTPCLVFFRQRLMREHPPSPAASTIGLILIALEVWIFWRVKADLGTARLVGKTELSGGGEVIGRGIYAHIRHPRYLGSFLAIVGACLMAGKPLAWYVATAWTLLMWIAIRFEEREMRSRFGASFEEYCRRVPRFLPLPARSR
ncbi:MAG TPA: isoprenylcysteine carboxylmethyltransferase family protein [Verrucomicrobiae bacterium]|nr:isoprenylcysteine carboxylmethyltransferase family protein [Verrucomicrobiae bacterium]